YESLLLTRRLKEQVEEAEEDINGDYNEDILSWLLQEVVRKEVLSIIDSEDCFPYRRREYENLAMIDHLLQLIGFVSPSDPVLYESFDTQALVPFRSNRKPDREKVIQQRRQMFNHRAHNRDRAKRMKQNRSQSPK